MLYTHDRQLSHLLHIVVDPIRIRPARGGVAHVRPAHGDVAHVRPARGDVAHVCPARGNVAHTAYRGAWGPHTAYRGAGAHVLHTVEHGAPLLRSLCSLSSE